jgi:acyl-coenzyme A synthetase/AMP-(fatty) acid ligase
MMETYPWDRFNESKRDLFVNTNEVITYKDFFGLVDLWKLQIENNGIGPYDKVAVIGDFSAVGTSLVLALIHNRNVIIPFSYDSIIEVENALSESGCDRLIVIDKHASISDQKFDIKIIKREAQLYSKLSQTEHAGLVLFSSGTSGKPKAILHDLTKVIQRFQPSEKRFRSVPMLMFDHFGGFNTIFGMLSSESTVIEVPSRSVEDVCFSIEKFQVNLLPTTPSFLSMILISNAHKRHNLSSLKRITYGTEPINLLLLERINAQFPGVLLQQTYGLSEVGVLASRSESNQSTRLELGGEGFQTRVIDGILWIKSDFAMMGYLSTEGQNDFVDGWFNTKDRVIQDGKYFKFIGRDSDQINVGGQKVLPIEIEETIMELSEVLEAQVFGEKHNLLGQVVAVNVVLVEKTDTTVIKDKIKNICKERLSKYKVPQKIYFVDQIAVSSRGKRIKSPENKSE